MIFLGTRLWRLKFRILTTWLDSKQLERVKNCLDGPTFHPAFQPTNFTNVGRGVQMTQHFIQHFYGGYDLNMLWRSCAFETGNHDQNANSSRCFLKENTCTMPTMLAEVFKTTQHFIQHLKTMELLATATQHFWLESNFAQHRKCQSLVTQHGAQAIQHCTQHQCWVNVGWTVGSFKQAFMWQAEDCQTILVLSMVQSLRQTDQY